MRIEGLISTDGAAERIAERIRMITLTESELQLVDFKCESPMIETIINAVSYNRWLTKITFNYTVPLQRYELANLARVARNKPIVVVDMLLHDNDYGNFIAQLGSPIDIAVRVRYPGMATLYAISTLFGPTSKLRVFKLDCVNIFLNQWPAAIATSIAQSPALESIDIRCDMPCELFPQIVVALADAQRPTLVRAHFTPMPDARDEDAETRLADLVATNMHRIAIDATARTLNGIDLVRFIDGDGAFRAAVRTALTR